MTTITLSIENRSLDELREIAARQQSPTRYWFGLSAQVHGQHDGSVLVQTHSVIPDRASSPGDR